MTITSSPAWQALAKHKETLNKTGAGLNDVTRLKNFDLALDGLRLNYAFQNVTSDTMKLLTDLAVQQNVESWRKKMFEGEKINATENRSVLHTALRRQDDTPLLVDGVNVMPQIHETQKRVERFVDDVRTGRLKGSTGKPFCHIVNIGIGGSDLGPRLAAKALQKLGGVDTRFVANVDIYDIESVLKDLVPEQTLFVVASKSFTTPETLLNAQTARRWLVEKLGDAAVAKHFIAVSVNAKAIEEFGISTDNMFPMWDWVGGRYSLWSAVGLSVALAIGNDGFRDLLAGAAAMDAHFQTAPLDKNMPVILALLGVWNRNFLGASSLAVLPYAERLRDLPRYLQQLDMESNGKCVTRAGAPVDYGTGPVIFGECGTVGQHSFHQWLHQGSDAIPADFIGIVKDDLGGPDHHKVLMLNLAAQMGALSFGQSEAPTPQDIYPGKRPSNLLLLEKLDPYRLGLLLALYEHKVFVQGIIWDINSFDQPGVELGKRMARMLDGGTAQNTIPAAAMIDALYKSINS